jgi:signal transduction protein with GAF and PtsI domain
MTKESAQLNALRKISEVISSDLVLQDILSLIVKVTAKVMHSEICSLMLIDEEQQTLILKATQSMDKAYNSKPPIKLGTGIAGKVALDDKPRQILDVLKNKNYLNKDIAQKCGLKSLLCIPLRAHGKVIGVINNYTTVPHVFSKSEIDTLVSIASQAGLVISNYQLQLQVAQAKEELESRKMIEKAKWILVKQKNINEHDALKMLQAESMNKRKPLKDIAAAVIMVEEMG